METVKIEVKMRGAVKWDEQAKVYLSYAPAFNIYSQGITSVEAQEALKSAVHLFLQTAYDENIFEKTLRRRGFDLASAEEVAAAEDAVTVLKELAFTEFFEVPAVLSLQAA